MQEGAIDPKQIFESPMPLPVSSRSLLISRVERRASRLSATRSCH